MRFALGLPMTNDGGMAGNNPSRRRNRWDLSFLDPGDCPSSHPLPMLWNGRKTSCDGGTVEGVMTPAAPYSPADVTSSSSVGRRHSFIPPQSPLGMSHSSGKPLTCMNGNPFRPLDHVTLPFSTHRHVYQNGGLAADDVIIASPETVITDQVTRMTSDEGDGEEGGGTAAASRFFFPVINSPRVFQPGGVGGAGAAPCRGPSAPWLTVVTSTGSSEEADTESRSQSISSQDSSDVDGFGFRIRDDSGIGMGFKGEEGQPRRNSSAPALNDLSVVVCRPSPSPLIGLTSAMTPAAAAAAAAAMETKASGWEDNSTHSGVIDPLLTDNASQCEDSYMKVARFLPSWDLERLSLVFHRLSVSRFYLGRLSFDEAKFLLKGFPVGTFLLRDSSDHRFLFSLSVQTNRGTTSIRVVYEAGHFRLDSEPDQVHLMPTFDCVIRLIRHYIRLATNSSRRGVGGGGGGGGGTRNNFVFLETTGRKDTPVLLRRPWANRPSGLRHLCRLRINGQLGSKSVDRLQLIPSLKDFLKDYPYDI